MDVGAWLMASAALVTAVGGVYAARSGRRDASAQQTAANELERRSQAWEESQDALFDQSAMLVRIRADRDWERGRADAYRAALIAANLELPPIPPWEPPEVMPGRRDK